MQDHDAAMLAFAKLAGVSQTRKQLGPRDKFLLLTGNAACQAGWPAVADRCRELVLANNRAHLIGRFDTYADALRDSDFGTFLKQLSRFCSYEKAEHLLSQLEISPTAPTASSKMNPGDYALLLLGHSERR